MITPDHRFNGFMVDLMPAVLQRLRRPLALAAIVIAFLAPAVTRADPPSSAAEPATPRFWTDREGLALPLPDEDEAFTFAIFGDRTGGPAAGVAVLADAVDDVNLIGPDLVMTVGDLIEGYSTVDPWMAQMVEFRGIMDRLDAPWFPVAGNHDVYWRGPDRPAEEHERRYETHFGPLWYAFEHKQCLFVVLYSDEGNPDTGERNFRKPDCQRMSPEQFDWLDGILDDHADARHVFVFLHHPRWIGGQYGDDWDRVHERLVAAGNVSAVFAGHIHRMRYDPKDGIEYLTLATVGGHQPGYSADAGFLHQYHLVTVRDDALAMAALPVGEVLDPRAITGAVSTAMDRLARSNIDVDTQVAIGANGSASGTVLARVMNPTEFPVDLAVTPESADGRWRFGPDHRHATLEPGESIELDFAVSRGVSPVDAGFRIPAVRVDAELLAGGRRFAARSTTATTRPTVEIPVAWRGGDGPDRGLQFDGVDDHLVVPHDALVIPDGPMTVEAWIRGDDYRGRRGLLARTESSEHGIFVSNGRPGYFVHLDGRYAEATAPEPVLETGRWHHVAGVFDGAEVRMYVDGELVARVPGSGRRTGNRLPFMIGADVDGSGRATSHFSGIIDDVRVSTTARYTGSSFDPSAELEPDEHTVLHLDLDRAYGPWWIDRSESGAHAITRGSPTVVTGHSVE